MRKNQTVIENILEFRSVSHGFGNLEVLRDISLSVGKGRALAILGPSGSGKSTLLNIAAGLIQPEEGEVLQGGLSERDGEHRDADGAQGERVGEHRGADGAQGRRGKRSEAGDGLQKGRSEQGRQGAGIQPGWISYMQQDDLLLPWKTVLENIALPLVLGSRVRVLGGGVRAGGLGGAGAMGNGAMEPSSSRSSLGETRPRSRFLQGAFGSRSFWRRGAQSIRSRVHQHKKEAYELVRSGLVDFGLAGFEHYYPDQLSGGMRQRAALMRASLYKSDFFLLDEPFSRLDSLTRMRMHDWFQRYMAELGAGYVLVTHDPQEAILLADEVVVFSERPARIIDRVQIPAPRPRARKFPLENIHLLESLIGQLA